MNWGYDLYWFGIDGTGKKRCLLSLPSTPYALWIKHVGLDYYCCCSWFLVSISFVPVVLEQEQHEDSTDSSANIHI